jgi:hypothetical protein
LETGAAGNVYPTVEEPGIRVVSTIAMSKDWHSVGSVCFVEGTRASCRLQRMGIHRAKLAPKEVAGAESNVD